MESEIFCAQCGGRNKAGSTFCGFCGTNLQVSTAPTNQPSNPSIDATPQPQTYVMPQGPTTAVIPRKSWHGTAALIIGILSIVVFTWFPWFIIGGPLISGPLLIVSIAGAIFGYQGIKYAKQHQLPGDTNAKIGMILCIVGSIILFGNFLFDLIIFIN